MLPLSECPQCGTSYEPRTDRYTCPECGTEHYPQDDDDPGFEPPNCYVPGYGWRVI